MDKATTQKFLEAWIAYTGFSPGSVKDIRVEEDPTYKGTYAARVDVGDTKPFDFMVTGCNPVTMDTDGIAYLIEECEFDVFPPRVRGR